MIFQLKKIELVDLVLLQMNNTLRVNSLFVNQREINMDTCICCGNVVPEGIIACINCTLESENE
jgi:hypothetical protein